MRVSAPSGLVGKDSRYYVFVGKGLYFAGGSRGSKYAGCQERL